MMRLNNLRVASCMAPNADGVCRSMVGYLQRKLGLPMQFVDDISWEERERQFDGGEIQLCWLCGLPYVWKADTPAPEIELVAAPVMAAARYARQPLYFSDVVVHQRSRFMSFADLRQASWAYNEPNSHSGYNVVRYHLSQLGEYEGYFGAAVESGAHQESLRMIVAGQVDASAIDSTVLEQELRRDPAIGGEIRVIGTLGPSPMPPWVMRRDLPSALKQTLRNVFLEMGEDAEGAAILQRWGMMGFVAVADADYNPIRQMSQACDGVRLSA